MVTTSLNIPIKYDRLIDQEIICERLNRLCDGNRHYSEDREFQTDHSYVMSLCSDHY